MLKFKSTNQFGKEILSSGDIGKASRAIEQKNYEEAVSIYRGILERGGDTVGEVLACEKLAGFYRAGRCVEQNLEYAIELECKAKESHEKINKNSH